MKYNKKDKEKIFDELRKRVIEKDRFLKEKKDTEELQKATKEALLEMTDLSKDDIDTIENEIMTEFILRNKKRKNKIVVISSIFIILIIIFITIIVSHRNSTNKTKTDYFYLLIDTDTHHLGDNQGNEGTFFLKDFYISDLSQYSSAIFQISFTKWGPNTNQPPLITLNSMIIGSVIENLPEPGTDDCWSKPASDNSYDYNCDFTYEKEVIKLLKQGNNTFEIKSRKLSDDFLFRNVQIILKSK